MKTVLAVMLMLVVIVSRGVAGSDAVKQCGEMAQLYLTNNSKPLEDNRFYEVVTHKLTKTVMEKRSGKLANMFYSWAYGVDFDNLTAADRITVCRYLVFCLQNSFSVPDALKEKLTVEQFAQFLSPATILASDP